PQQAADRGEQRGLARPVRPYHAGDPASGHAEGYVVQYVPAAIAADQPLDDERGVLAGRPPAGGGRLAGGGLPAGAPVTMPAHRRPPPWCRGTRPVPAG